MRDCNPIRPILTANGGIILNLCGIGSKSVLTVSNDLPGSIENTVVFESKKIKLLFNV